MLDRIIPTVISAALLVPSNAWAGGHSYDVAALFDTMRLGEMLEIMQAEGLDYGDQIATDLFPGRPDASWAATVQTIYDIDIMTNTVRDGMTSALANADIDAITAFYASDLGQDIVELEVAARRALMDEDVEEASKMAAATELTEETPRSELLRDFVDANDLIETNVVGAMNANYAFYIGLQDGGGLPRALSEEDILTDVWSQEAEIRQNTSEWVYSYANLAYQPLSDEDLQLYIDFSNTDAGQDINTALFMAFDTLFEEISEALGRSASEYMVGQDL